MKPVSLPARPAFTLVELLVVLAVTAALVGLLLPAVQKTRAAAAATACRNNLHQIGLALHHHHGDRGAFPVGCVEWRPATDPSRRQLAWSAFLLPYLEQKAVADRLDLSLAFDHPANAPAAACVVKGYLCPASRRREPVVHGRGASDYGGIFGERITSPNNPPKGVMLLDVAVRFADIPDGTSATAAVSEDCAWADGQWVNGRNLFDQAFPINQAPAFENDMRSDHPPGGVNALFCDGSARFLRDSLAPTVLAALCTRAGGEPAGDF